MKKIEKSLEYLSVGLLALLAGVLTFQIIMRFFGYPILGTVELSRFTVVYLTFLGGAYSYYKGENLRITLLIDKFPTRIKKINNTIITIVGFVMVFIILYGSSLFLIEVWDSQTTVLGWNKGIVYAIVPVSLLLISIKMIRNFKELLRTN